MSMESENILVLLRFERKYVDTTPFGRFETFQTIDYQ
jgi:hypothetical protein